MSERLAVIDLGSNTFHLLIVDVSDMTMKTVYRERIFTGLSDGGVDMIKDQKIAEGLDAIRYFKKKLTKYGSPKVTVIGTAVLRHARNRDVFINQAETILSTNIRVIDGSKEADYIYKGIILHKNLQIGNHLVMDVGGGSTEFIIIQDGKKIWANSYPLGVGILHQKFHNTEPISSNELKDLYDYVAYMTSDLIQVARKFSPISLTGASGSFEILQLMTQGFVDEHSTSTIDNNTFVEIYHQIVSADIVQRINLKGLPPQRAKLIVVGMALKMAIFKMIEPTNLIVSPYALKEGVLHDMMNELSK